MVEKSVKEILNMMEERAKLLEIHERYPDQETPDIKARRRELYFENKELIGTPNWKQAYQMYLTSPKRYPRL